MPAKKTPLAKSHPASWLQFWGLKDFTKLSDKDVATKKALYEKFVRDYIKIINFSNKQEGKPEYKANLAWALFVPGKPKKSRLSCVLNPIFTVKRPRRAKGGGPGQITPTPPPDPGKK